MKYIQYPSKEELRELFTYHANGKLVWIKNKGRAKAGSFAGCLDKSDGYWQVKINGQDYRLNRLIWIWHNGRISEGYMIDHINGNRADDRIQNLRPITNQLNQTKRKARTNRTGYIGVSQKRDKFTAALGVDNKKVHLGTFPDPVSAALAYDNAAIKQYGIEYSNLNFK